MQEGLSDHAEVSQVLRTLLDNNLWLLESLGLAASQTAYVRACWYLPGCWALGYFDFPIVSSRGLIMRVLYEFHSDLIRVILLPFREALRDNIQDEIDTSVNDCDQGQYITSWLPFESVYHEAPTDRRDYITKGPGTIIHSTALIGYLLLVSDPLLILDGVDDLGQQRHKRQRVSHSDHEHRDQWQVPVVKGNSRKERWGTKN